jgi:hypothetical protein
MPETNLKPAVLAPNSRLRIVLLGYIVRGPLGGLVWHHLQTGFTRLFESEQKGLLAFTNLQEAVAGLEAVDRDYALHCAAAKRVAETITPAFWTIG